jgi:hypothetical protein
MTKFFNITFDEPCNGFGTGLRCPLCEESNLHQGEVIIWNRKGEDDDLGLMVRVDGQKYNADDDQFMAGNPSSRRDGMTIEFVCEHCEAAPILAIFQHKGTTFLKWVQVLQNLAG